ncbi:MAG: oligosaccharide flippase family protein [Sedimentisphaerales bacterium]|nr:oligosaccharide flippase family protein [Sedimentisphaerales bacterium]
MINSKSITTSKRLAYNTFSNILMLVSNALISFFLIRFFLSHLGQSRYGIWMLVGSIFSYRGLIGMGVNSSINRYIPVYLAQKNDKGIQDVVSTSFFFFLFLMFIVLIASVVICYNAGTWFLIEPNLVRTASIVVFIVGVCAGLSVPLQLYSAVLSGFQRYDLINFTTLVVLLIRTALLVILLTRGYGLITMAYIFGFSEILMKLIVYFFAKKLLTHISVSIKNINLKLLKEMLAYGTNTFLYSMGAVLICKASDLVIGIFIGTAEISQYAVTTSVVLLLSQFLQAFTTATKPAVSDLHARDEHARVLELSFLMQKYTLLFIIPACSFLVIMGKEFLWIWVGEKFNDPVVVGNMSIILTILAIAHGVRLTQQSNFVVLVGRGDHRVFGIITIATAILCIILAIISVKIFKSGLVGIAWANFTPMMIAAVFLPIYFNRKMKIAAKDTVKQVWIPALAGTLPAMVTIGIWKYVSPPQSWLPLLMVVFTAMAVTLLSSWLLSFSKLEQERFMRVIHLRK